MEIGESAIPIADFDIRKPDFKKDQERVLDSVRVLPISDERFDEFRNIYTENKDFCGFKIITPDESKSSKKISFRQNREGIVVVQKLQTLGPLKLSKDILVVDSKSGIFFEVDQLKSLNKNDKDVTYISYSTEPGMIGVVGFINSEFGGRIIWSESEIELEMYDSEFGEGSGEVFSLLGLFHEFGHRYQFKPSETEEWFHLFADDLKKSSFSFKRKNVEGQEKLIKEKQIIKEEERNAWAFALSLTMKLKHLGVDITRGLTSQQVNGWIDDELQGYDVALKRIPGNQISNQERKKAAK